MSRSVTERPWHATEHFRFPFVIPRIPSLDRVDAYFQASRDARFYSNFGPASFNLEDALNRAYFPHARTVTCSSCTNGLSAALIALRLAGPVLVPAFTFAATLSAVRGAGLVPVTVDVDMQTGIIDPDHVVSAARRTGADAVVAVRPYGIWTDLRPLTEACRHAGVQLIIDNAAGLGVAPHVVRRFAVRDTVEVFSLHATKPFGIGEGGIAAAPHDVEHDLRSALNFGLWSRGKLPPGAGLNGKMGDLSAAMANVVLDDMPARLLERQRMAARLNARAARAGLTTWCHPGEEEVSPWQCFPVVLPEPFGPSAIAAACAAAGLQVRRYYHPAVTAGGEEAAVPVARMLADRVVCLPVYDGEDADEADEIWDIFARCLR